MLLDTKEKTRLQMYQEALLQNGCVLKILLLHFNVHIFGKNIYSA